MSDINEALYQLKQRIMMHQLDDTTSNENEREKIILNYINELQNRINKAIEYIETLEKQEAYKIEDNENGVPELKVDNEEYLVLCKYNKLLNILKGSDNK